MRFLLHAGCLLFLCSQFPAQAQVPAYLQSMQSRNPTSYQIFSMNYRNPPAAGSSGSGTGSSGSNPSFSFSKSKSYSKADYRRMEKESVARAQAGDMAEIRKRMKYALELNRQDDYDYWLQKAAEFGDISSMIYRAQQQQDLYTRVKLFRELYEKGSPAGVDEIADYYLNTGNLSEGLSWLRRAALYNPSRNYELARYYFRDASSVYDTVKGRMALQDGARNGDSTCSQMLRFLSSPATRARATLALQTNVEEVENITGKNWMILSKPREYQWAGNSFWTWQYALCDLDGKPGTGFVYDAFKLAGNQLLLLRKGGLWYIADARGVLNNQQGYAAVFDAGEGLLAVNVGGFWGFINRNGREIIPPRFYFTGSFVNGKCRVAEGDYSFDINREGQSVPGFRETISWVREGMKLRDKNNAALIFDIIHTDTASGNHCVLQQQDEGNGRVLGIMSPDLKWVLPPLYFTRQRTFNQPDILVYKNGFQGVVNMQGSLLVEPVWDSVQVIDRKQALWRVWRSGHAGVLQSGNRVVVPVVFENVIPKAGVSHAKTPLGKIKGWEVWRKGRKQILDEQGNPAHDTTLHVLSDGDVMILRKNNRVFIAENDFSERCGNLTYDEISPYLTAGLLPVARSGNWGLLQLSKCQEAVPCLYDSIQSLPAFRRDLNYVLVRKNGLWGVFDAGQRKIVVAPDFQQISNMYQGPGGILCEVRQGSFWGVINIVTGLTVVPLIYEGVADPGILTETLRYRPFARGWLYREQNGPLSGWIDSTGLEKIPAGTFQYLEALSPRAFFVHQNDPAYPNMDNYTQQYKGLGKVGLVNENGEFLIPWKSFDKTGLGAEAYGQEGYLMIEYKGRKIFYGLDGSIKKKE